MRDTFIVLFAIIVAVIVGAYFFFNGSNSLNLGGAPADQGTSTYSILQQGSSSGSIDTRTNYRIENDEELADLWRLIYGTSGPAIPSVDFSKYEIIAVFDGSHSTGGYKIDVTDVKDAGGKRTIRIRHTAPGDRCSTSDSITSPFQIVRVSKTTLPITREEEDSVTQC